MKAQIVLVEDNPGDVILVKEALYSRGLRVDLCVIDTEGQADEFFSTLGANEHPCPFWFCSTRISRTGAGEVLTPITHASVVRAC